MSVGNLASLMSKMPAAVKTVEKGAVIPGKPTENQKAETPKTDGKTTRAKATSGGDSGHYGGKITQARRAFTGYSVSDNLKAKQAAEANAKAKTDKAETTKAETKKVDAPKAEAPKTEAKKTDAPNTESQEAAATKKREPYQRKTFSVRRDYSQPGISFTKPPETQKAQTPKAETQTDKTATGKESTPARRSFSGFSVLDTIKSRETQAAKTDNAETKTDKIETQKTATPKTESQEAAATKKREPYQRKNFSVRRDYSQPGISFTKPPETQKAQTPKAETQTDKTATGKESTPARRSFSGFSILDTIKSRETQAAKTEVKTDNAETKTDKVETQKTATRKTESQEAAATKKREPYQRKNFSVRRDYSNQGISFTPPPSTKKA
jgi:hypothetical protein